MVLFARKREQGCQDWLDENRGPHELPFLEYDPYGRRASVGVSDNVDRFLAEMLNNTNNKERLVIVCQLVFSGPLLSVPPNPQRSGAIT